MRYPPLLSLVNVVVRGRTFAGAMDDAADIVAAAAASWRPSATSACSGPAPAPLGKLRGEYRAQLLIKGTEPQADAGGADVGARGSPGSRAANGGGRRSASVSESQD